MGTKQETVQFKCLENRRVVGIFSRRGHFYTPDPNFPAKHSDYRLRAQAARLGGGGGGTGRPRLRLWRLPWPTGGTQAFSQVLLT